MGARFLLLVKRREGLELGEGSEDLRVDPDRGREARTAVHDAVADRGEVTMAEQLGCEPEDLARRAVMVEPCGPGSLGDALACRVLHREVGDEPDILISPWKRSVSGGTVA